jgi:hypothetical protein
MADQSTTSPPPQDQKQRWLKYGANVVLTVLVAIVLAVVVIAIAQRRDKRFDTTSNSQYSLKPQTLNIIRDLKQPIRLVSLYAKTDAKQQQGVTDYAGAVADLLDEYHQNSNNIQTEVIDPVDEPGKVNDLVAYVSNKYGGEVKQYRDFVDKAPQYFTPISQFADAELARLKALPTDPMKQDDVDQTLSSVVETLSDLPARLKKQQKSLDALTAQKVPDYKGAADTINTETSRFGDIADLVIDRYTKLQSDPAAVPPIKRYMADAIPRWQSIKKTTDSAAADYKKLGDLKLDDIRTKLREQNAILVMGPTDMRSLSSDQVWQVNTDKRAYANAAEGEVKPKFAGEQQITSAILQLTQAKKPEVVFLRPGGPPLTTPGFPPFQAGGPFSLIAQRLKDYNFDVLEKDTSGQYAMQAQMQGEQVAPEPTDADIKDAVWVLLSIPAPQNQQGAPPPPTYAAQLAEHLKNGGSAICLFLPTSDNLSAAMDEFGVSAHTDMLAVHEAIVTAASSGDVIEEARKTPSIFILNNYGDSIIAKPLRSLDSAFVRLLPISTVQKSGFATSALIPVPQTPPAWGEHDVQSAMNGEPQHFDAAAGDLGPPLFGGAMSENSRSGARLVAIGSIEFITDSLIKLPDPELAQRHINASRFPANSELFLNSIFWLAHQEPLIAISPNAMEVNRIGDMSDGALRMWRIGALLIGLPGLVIVGGVGVYLARRD